jgi:hypothetical protein
METEEGRAVFREATTPGIASPTDSQCATPMPPMSPAQDDSGKRSRRPQIGAPRRSYSVMDYEPVLPHHQPGGRLSLAEVPGEIHMAIFDWLDPIDSACLGLTNKHFYAVHRRMHGTVPLSARRSGPNDMERAWYLASRPMNALSPGMSGIPERDLAMLRVKGKGLCRKCGVYRCELNKHLKEWMPEGAEYCSIREKFGPPAPEGAKEYCFLVKPNRPDRCGRHRDRPSKDQTTQKVGPEVR